MNHFWTPASPGVTQTFVVMEAIYGGFATIPAYLRDIFGTMQVGAIHWRLLTAWSMALFR